ncbi:MAG TPA: Tex family protein [Catalimonadaceae bacterium]|nr:Tex family protein [Catalimonadaceae bacterium]
MITENPAIRQQVASELNLTPQQISAVDKLLSEGATVPFIARYRKEVTGSLDEVQIAAIRDRLEQLEELRKRKEFVLKSIEEQGKLTPELRAKIGGAVLLSEVEDLYLPYKPKRKTRATIAREKGLEPLALRLLEQDGFSVDNEAERFISAEKGVASIDEALAGARDIIAETINEDAETRQEIRSVFKKTAVIIAKVYPGKEAEGQKYRDYFEWTEPLSQAPSHRILAIRRAEAEQILSLDISPDEEQANDRIQRRWVKSGNAAGKQVSLAAKDCFKRLMKPSLETEFRLESKERADVEAIRIFAENVRQLLMSAPLGQKRTLAIDPGFRTGCKVVCLDAQGKLIHFEAIYPHEPQRQTTQAGKTIQYLVEKFNMEAIAIGNGTAGRETEEFVKRIGLPSSVAVVMVNESGASIYSASEVAREEFPDQDITVRGAVSIGRRLMDPMAELVKIDPKSIGVGQYQHDVDQKLLKSCLDDVVMRSVNGVGVEVNTASKQLLSYVSGLGPVLAQNIVDYRNQNGPFPSRAALKKVPRMGEKAFEQCAGFLRIRSAKNPLDASAVHPERYELVNQMAKDLWCTPADLISNAEIRQKIDVKKYINGDVGLPTLKDIVSELARPGLDPREKFEVFQFQDGIEKISDLRPGMSLPGIITNITAFGAFVDIGVHQDGLVHTSQLANRFVKDPNEVVKLGQKVTVRVVEVDIARKRISLSMKEENGPNPGKKKEPEPEVNLQDKLKQLQGKWK